MNDSTYSIQQRAEYREHYLLIGGRGHVCNGLYTFDGQNGCGHVHGLACESQEKSQYLRPVALELFGRGNRCVAAHTALPDSIGDLVFSRRHFRQSELGEEKQINQRVNSLLSEGLRFLELWFICRGCLLGVGFVEEHLTSRQLAPPTTLAALRPEELVLPLLKMVGLIQERQEAGEYAYTVEGISLRRKLWVGEGRVVAQDDEARGDGED